MPRGPRGEKRPANVIGAAVKVMRIATGEETEELPEVGWLALIDARDAMARWDTQGRMKCDPPNTIHAVNIAAAA
jgi:hypothetical protein